MPQAGLSVVGEDFFEIRKFLIPNLHISSNPVNKHIYSLHCSLGNILMYNIYQIVVFIYPAQSEKIIDNVIFFRSVQIV